MADKKISALTGASTPLAGTEVIPIVQSGSTVKVAVSNLTAGRAVSAASVTATGTIQAAIVDAISGTGDVFLINAKTNDATAANNAGVGLRANASAIAANRFAQLWFDADGANLSGGDYLLITKSGSDGSADIINYSPAVMRFAANYIGRAAFDLTIETTGNVTVNNGNLVIGTAGKGIDFSATSQAAGMTSELLADYEEGTWTPAITGWTSISYAYQNGNYTKIGNQVTAWFYLVFSGTSSASAVQIANLPYTVGAAATSGGSMTYYDAPLNETSGVVVYPGPTTTTLSLYQDNDSGLAVQSNGNAVSSYLTGSVTYRV